MGGVILIEFTVEGTTYQAEEGMTWQEWVDSEYNVAEVNINGTMIWFVDGLDAAYVIRKFDLPSGYNWLPVDSTDVIVPNAYNLTNEPLTAT